MASEAHYRQQVKFAQAEVDKSDKTIRHYAWVRVALAIVILATGYLGFSNSLFFAALPILIIPFFSLVQLQQRKEYDRKILLSLVELNGCEIEAIHFRFRNFPSGNQFINPQHPYSHDLDLFGDRSLFQYLNRCATQLGESRLANDLTHLRYNQQAIELRQQAIRELASTFELRQQCWATGQQNRDIDFKLVPLLNWLKEPDLFLGKSFFQIIKWVLPLITCFSLIGVAFAPIFQSVFFFFFIVQLSLAAGYSKSISVLQAKLAGYKVALENYSMLFRLLKKESFASPLILQHHQLATQAAESVHEFSKRVNSLESRMNLIARLFGNGLFLFDFHNVSRLEAWRKQHAETLPQWLESLAEWDSLLAFATFHYNHPNYAFAEIHESMSIYGEDIGHPLIPSNTRVANSFELGLPNQLLLITGANMAGKSTFLRAIGVNYVLGLNGAPVCATKWRSPMAALRSGMRTSDSLQENQSYFFAELNRLQSIIEDLRNGKPMLILLDEILKGTNSTDKQTGSRELIKQLITQKALVVIATHDIALGDMEAQFPNQVANGCFEGKIENDQLTFDYKLNKGIAQKANATFLMRKMGIIP